jgi:hypothetical protein
MLVPTLNTVMVDICKQKTEGSEEQQKAIYNSTLDGTRALSE